MQEGTEIEHAEPRDEIAQLEEYIEELTAKIENCRKFILASRVAAALGGLTLLAGMFGAIRPDIMVMAAAGVATLGGIVVFGSNSSTAREAAAELADAEARRALLIGQLDLRVIGNGDGANPQ